MAIKKINDFEVGYRKGAVFTLNCLINMFGEKKIREDKISIPLKVYFNAMLEKLDLFLDYGDTITFAFSKHDKKGNPTKAEVYKSVEHYKRKQKLDMLLYVMQLENKVNND